MGDLDERLELLSEKSVVETTDPPTTMALSGSPVPLADSAEGATWGAAVNEQPGEAPVPSTRAAKWPRSILFIIGNEFCERFCYYGMRTVLTLYFLYYLGFSEDSAVSSYHAFIMMAYITPVFGGALADGSWGKFKTIFVLSVVYVMGTAVMSITAIPGATGADPPSPWGAYLGLFLIAVGTGGIKPCVAAFGGDQIDQGGDGVDNAAVARMVQSYFAAFYFAINGGSFVSTLVTPKLRADVSCFGRDDCFPAAFGVPGLLMLIATLIFLAGRKQYKMKTPTRNVTADFAGAVWLSMKHRLCGGRSRVRYPHMLDAANKKYGREFIEDVKSALGVMWLFLPLPIFWTLFDQSGSRWTVQATQMKTFSMGDLGEFRPDQMQAANSLLILLFIPLFERGVYPIFEKMGVPLHPLFRMTFGMLLCAVSFVLAAVIQMHIDSDSVVQVPTASGNTSMVRFLNAGADAVNATMVPDTLSVSLPSGGVTAYQPFVAGILTFGWDGLLPQPTIDITLSAGAVYTVVMYAQFAAGSAADSILIVSDVFDREGHSAPVATSRVSLVNAAPSVGNATLFSQFAVGELNLVVPFKTASSWSSGKLEPGQQTIEISNGTAGTLIQKEMELINGADYMLVLTDAGDGVALNSYIAVGGGSVSILWQLPQYAVMTVGEILFSITGLEFAFTQAPESMKALLQAAWLLTVAVGSFIVIVVAESKLIDDQASEFFFFAGLQAGVSLIFAVMARVYSQKRRRHTAGLDDRGDSEATSLLIPSKIEG